MNRTNAASAPLGGIGRLVERFGENVFSIKTMRNYLSEETYRSLVSTIYQGQSLNPSIADEVAEAMKTWALEKGATHFTHWFQPLTGVTAEKHEAFIIPDREGGALTQFLGSSLIQGEPDASSFPSGGLRATFEARGYTAWDPTSPAFIKESPQGSTLCIPTVFCGYHGEALDKKTPLLRSMHALSKQVERLARLFKLPADGRRATVTLGPEQEYFLVDRRFYEKRLDLMQTGRTLFGRRPAKHQQMEDHYFGEIKSRVMAFMCEVDRELWRLGVPAKTRHNEVCPGQFELAPLYEELNLAVDHNMLVMVLLRETAERHGLVCLLHEKPYAGVNGSGKHNNWSICGPDGKNWLAPGDSPHENAKFLTVLCALIQGVDRHAGLLRATVATAGNDQRLGGHEAPPAILSIYLGEQLTEILLQLERGSPTSSRKNGTIEIGVSSLPALARDSTDRNRTSPFAFSGNKFEFRAVGSNQSCAGPNVALNTIMAEALDGICTQLEKALAEGREFNASLQAILGGLVRRHKRIVFNGDNYSKEWLAEAARRGLPNAVSTPEALKALVEPASIKLFSSCGVLSERELRSRYEVYRCAYEKTVRLEAECAATIARTLVAPAVMDYETRLAQSIAAVAPYHRTAVRAKKRWLKNLASESERLLTRIEALESALARSRSEAARRALESLRETVDTIEGLVPDNEWPLPSYADMMFRL